MTAVAHDLVVLAGGRGRRLGGVDKAGLVIGGRTLLDRVLAAAPRARRSVVVGPHRPTERAVTWCREDPPGGGPVAALAAGWPLVSAPVVVVLAVDLAYVDEDTVDRLLGECQGRHAAIAIDGDGRDQPLLAAYDRIALRDALASLDAVAGTAVRALVALLDVARVPVSDATLDCDSWADVALARARAGEIDHLGSPLASHQEGSR